MIISVTGKTTTSTTTTTIITTTTTNNNNNNNNMKNNTRSKCSQINCTYLKYRHKNIMR